MLLCSYQPDVKIVWKCACKISVILALSLVCFSLWSLRAWLIYMNVFAWSIGNTFLWHRGLYLSQWILALISASLIDIPCRLWVDVLVIQHNSVKLFSMLILPWMSAMNNHMPPIPEEFPAKNLLWVKWGTRFQILYIARTHSGINLYGREEGGWGPPSALPWLNGKNWKKILVLKGTPIRLKAEKYP
jgi:hypothetical protein